MNEKTIRLFHKADWIDINFSIRTTMMETTLNKRNVTEDEIDNYVDTLTNTITSVIAEKVPTKFIKRNSMGLPIEIRELIRHKRHQRRLWQKTRVPQYKTNANRLQKQISKEITTRKRDSWKKYCDDMELSEGQDATWCKIKSVLNPKSASYNYATFVSRDKGGGGDKGQISDYIREIGHLRFPVESGLYQRNREHCFRRGGKDRRRRRIRSAFCQSKANLPAGHTLSPRHPS